MTGIAVTDKEQGYSNLREIRVWDALMSIREHP